MLHFQIKKPVVLAVLALIASFSIVAQTSLLSPPQNTNTNKSPTSNQQAVSSVQAPVAINIGLPAKTAASEPTSKTPTALAIQGSASASASASSDPRKTPVSTNTGILGTYLAAQKNALTAEITRINESTYRSANPSSAASKPSDAASSPKVVASAPKVAASKIPIYIPAPPPEPFAMGIIFDPETKKGIAEMRFLDRIYRLQNNEAISNSGWTISEITPTTVTIYKMEAVTVVLPDNKKVSDREEYLETGQKKNNKVYPIKNKTKGTEEVAVKVVQKPQTTHYNKITRVFRFPLLQKSN